jgi:cell division transport system ATP-binding protein
MTSSSSAGLPAMVVFERVGKRFGTRTVLKELSFSIARNEFVLLSGPSGAGKTMVLKLIAAIEAPTEGLITVAGERLDRLKASTLPHMRRFMGVVTHDLMLLNDRSVRDNVALPAVVSGLGRREAGERALVALQRVGLDDATAAAAPSALSAGGRQLVALARAIVSRPALLLVDEPTAHVDAATARLIIQLLEQFAGAGVTIVMASHLDTFPLSSRSRMLQLDRLSCDSMSAALPLRRRSLPLGGTARRAKGAP